MLTAIWEAHTKLRNDTDKARTINEPRPKTNPTTSALPLKKWCHQVPSVTEWDKVLNKHGQGLTLLLKIISFECWNVIVTWVLLTAYPVKPQIARQHKPTKVWQRDCGGFNLNLRCLVFIKCSVSNYSLNKLVGSITHWDFKGILLELLHQVMELKFSSYQTLWDLLLSIYKYI